MDEPNRTERLTALDHAHVWHPFTPMRQWRSREPVIIERGEGDYLIDTRGNRYIDGVSSLWCNVHGHRVPQIDQAIRDQLDRIAHSTMLGLASTASIELAARLVALAGKGQGPGAKGQGAEPDPQSAIRDPHSSAPLAPGPSSLGPSLNKVFFSDAGATALEVAFKMAMGYWYHTGHPKRTHFIGFSGAYHGDTTGSMSVGYSETFHRPFLSMVFPTLLAPVPHIAPLSAAAQSPGIAIPGLWANEASEATRSRRDACLRKLDAMLTSNEGTIAAVVIEPLMQGAAGMISQPAGFLRGVADLVKKHNTLLIADEVATGFGRTGKMFACEHEAVMPDILCLAKGITGGYLPLAATLCTDVIAEAFEGELSEGKTFFHGHTYTGNPLACAAALASLDLFETNNLLDHINASSAIITDRLNALRDRNAFAHIIDIRQRGLMVGIELDPSRCPAPPGPPRELTNGHAFCLSLREQGLIVRPLGNVIVLMPIPAMKHDTLHAMLDLLIEGLRAWRG
ncbi:MAG: aminotransferase class III-fold pyridoxal phosphate-dependent enzyme [Phycisphaeraceae bacterium]